MNRRYQIAMDERMQALAHIKSWSGGDRYKAELIHNIKTGPTYFITNFFRRLIDATYESMPGDSKFEEGWLVTEYGWAYVENYTKVEAIGWTMGIDTLGKWWNVIVYGNKATSCMRIRDGDRVDERIIKANDMQDEGERDRYKWSIAALNLMSRRIAVKQIDRLDRATSRRLARIELDIEPEVRTITLRKKEIDRLERIGPPRVVNWKFRWIVGDFYRMQWYPSQGVHRRIKIEAYKKGPEGRPFKKDQIPFYVAKD